MGAVEENGADRGGDVFQLNVVRAGANVEGDVAAGSQDEASAGAARQAVDRGVRARAALNLDQVAQYAGGPVNLEAVVRIIAGDNDCPGEDVLNCRDHARRTHSGLKGLKGKCSSQVADSTLLQHGYAAS